MTAEKIYQTTIGGIRCNVTRDSSGYRITTVQVPGSPRRTLVEDAKSEEQAIEQAEAVLETQSK